MLRFSAYTVVEGVMIWILVAFEPGVKGYKQEWWEVGVSPWLKGRWEVSTGTTPAETWRAFSIDNNRTRKHILCYVARSPHNAVQHLNSHLLYKYNSVNNSGAKGKVAYCFVIAKPYKWVWPYESINRI